jgi:hypothetical protein
LKDLKESFPVQVAEYVTSQGLQDLPAFRWWVKDNRQMMQLNMRISFKSHIMETYILEGPPRNGSFVLNGGMDLLFGRT